MRCLSQVQDTTTWTCSDANGAVPAEVCQMISSLLRISIFQSGAEIRRAALNYLIDLSESYGWLSVSGVEKGIQVLELMNNTNLASLATVLASNKTTSADNFLQLYNFGTPAGWKQATSYLKKERKCSRFSTKLTTELKSVNTRIPWEPKRWTLRYVNTRKQRNRDKLVLESLRAKCH